MLRAPKVEAGAAPPDGDHFYWRGDDVCPGETGFIFTTDIGTPIDPCNSDRWFSGQCTKARMPKAYTFHRLRHEYASILLKQKVASRVTQEMVRHAQYSTTASIYQHVATEIMFAAAQTHSSLQLGTLGDRQPSSSSTLFGHLNLASQFSIPNRGRST